MRRKIPILVVCGPTATGKTGLMFEIAERSYPIEIVSADSRQIFRYMDVGTAKPSSEELQRLPHHMIDICDPDEEYNAGRYGKDARQQIEAVYRRKNVPVVVGGSGLYLHSLIDGLFEGEARDPEVKKRLQARADEEGLGVLYDELQKVDPESAAKIHPNDRQRIVRALEAFYVSGQPISELRKRLRVETGLEPIFVGLTMEREALYRRIDERVLQMVRKGLVEEVVRLREMGYHRELQSQKTVGYQEIHAYLDGEIPLEVAIERIQRNTRRFAKRQFTWFKREQRILWFPVNTARERGQARKKIEEEIEKLLQFAEKGEWPG
jgi:tRNA dimethylallyltransferase